MRVLRDRWDHLPKVLRRLHTTLEPDIIHGKFDIKRGRNPGAALCGWLLNLPAEGVARDATLTIRPQGESERWTRRFESKILMTTLRAAGEHLFRERFGMLEFTFQLLAEGHGLRHLQRAAALRLPGTVSIPLPQWLAPHVSGIEEAFSDEVRVQVEVRLPLFGLLLAYDGIIRFPPHPLL